MKNKVIDINSILEDRKKQAWSKFVNIQVSTIKDKAEQLRWREIQLALLFDQYYAENGFHHPNDPALIDSDCYLAE